MIPKDIILSRRNSKSVYVVERGIANQRALKTGAKPNVMFGRNEAGGQRFHGWVDRLIAAEDDDAFAKLFADATTEFQP